MTKRGSADSAHRIRLDAKPAGAARLDSVAKGDVFLRHGTPCIRNDGDDPSNEKLCRITNLTNGSCWLALASDQVWLCRDISLTYTAESAGLVF